MNHNQKYIADNGTIFTDQDIDRWTQEAQNGFPHSEKIPFTGRAWETQTEPLTPRTIRLSDTMWTLIETQARAGNMTVSAWTRQALSNALAS